MTELTLFTLLHLLVFAYWLGGDLGVFYSSLLLTDNKRDRQGRIAAAKVLSDVDLAPRICLLLTLPTGIALADAKGWLAIPTSVVAMLFIAAIIWIFVVLKLHVSHGAAVMLRRFDFYLRIAFLAGLAACGIAGLAGKIDLPLFLSLKLLLLAFTISMGLAVRRALVPFGPAFGKLVAEGATPDVDAAIAQSLNRARPAVVAIWIALLVAVVLGIAKPV